MKHPSYNYKPSYQFLIIVPCTERESMHRCMSTKEIRLCMKVKCWSGSGLISISNIFMLKVIQMQHIAWWIQNTPPQSSGKDQYFKRAKMIFWVLTSYVLIFNGFITVHNNATVLSKKKKLLIPILTTFCTTKKVWVHQLRTSIDSKPSYP